MKLSKILAGLLALGLLGVVAIAALLVSMSASLPQMIKVEDYKPLLVSEVYARGGEKIGEYFRENRTLIAYDQVPQKLTQAFLAAEDDKFFEHGGVNYIAILRAFMINISSGEKRQGASTITQQVARGLLLSSEKTYTRKIKEIMLAHRMEENLSKEEILYLYLNQIYFGGGAYGVVAAADTYFRKTVDQLTLAEMAILAGLPQAPSSYSPTNNAQKAKARQRYVLERMATVGFITQEEKQQALNEPVTIYMGKEYKEVAPYFVETLRQILVQALGEKAVLDEGLRIYTSIDFKAQAEATQGVQEGLRELDKRQGWRGPIKNIETPEEQAEFLLASRRKLKHDKAPIRIIQPDGNLITEEPLATYQKKNDKGAIVSNIPEYITKGQIVEGLVTKVDDGQGLVTVRFAEGQGLIDIAEMGWARKPDPSVNAFYAQKITKPSAALKVGDVVQVRVHGDKFYSERLEKELANTRNNKGKNVKKADGETDPLADLQNYAHLLLEQEPTAEGGLLSFDQKTGEVIAMVGGKEFIRNKNEFNRTLQAKRQTGSSFKTIIYASALDKGFTPATPIQDAPIVYETKTEGDEEGQGDIKTWKPHNHGQKFTGDILFRTALIKSLNIPAVKVLEDIGIPWAIDYAHRLGVFSPMNQDLSLVLGSSSLTLYEMTKVFSHFGRLGKRIRPLVIHKVLDKDSQPLLENVTLDSRFEKESSEIEQRFEERRKSYLEQVAAAQNSPGDEATPEATPKPKVPSLFFNDPDQLISPQTAYVMTTLLSSVIHEVGGTGGAARALGRPSAGKTGTTNGYFDAWFVGYTPQIATGVWVGFDEERTLGAGEVGGRVALPIWVEYMKAAHKDLPIEDFPVPAGVVFANIDNETGRIASASSTHVVKQAFIQGTEPSLATQAPTREDETEFLKKDLTE